MEMDWIMGALGGLLIGTAGAVYLLGNGRIMGASGIIGTIVERSAGSALWERVVFIIGTALLPFVMLQFMAPVQVQTTTNPVLLIAAGLLVGFGTRLANGCTSGHGVCGISRLSPRGIVSTLIYIGAGAVVIGLFRHSLGVI